MIQIRYRFYRNNNHPSEITVPVISKDHLHRKQQQAPKVASTMLHHLVRSIIGSAYNKMVRVYDKGIGAYVKMLGAYDKV
jgi:hypothetical protein